MEDLEFSSVAEGLYSDRTPHDSGLALPYRWTAGSQKVLIISHLPTLRSAQAYTHSFQGISFQVCAGADNQLQTGWNYQYVIRKGEKVKHFISFCSLPLLRGL